MKTIFANQSIPNSVSNSLFIAGPSPRQAEVKSWRPEALELLEKFNFPGTVFIPEQSDWIPCCGLGLGTVSDYEDQVEWEMEALIKSDVIVFWVPRELNTMPGYTTNVEFGWWMNSGKIVLGAPKDAPKMSFLQWHAARLGIPQSETLKGTLEAALKLLNDIHQKS